MVARYAIIVARHLTGAKRLMTGRIYNAVIATASSPGGTLGAVLRTAYRHAEKLAILIAENQGSPKL